MEFIRQMQITFVTGVWTIFEVYVVYVWAAMLPRMLLAGVFYSFLPPKPTRLSVRYMLGHVVSFCVFAWVWYQYALDNVSEWVLIIATALVVLAVAFPLRRVIVQWLFSWTFYAKHVQTVKAVSKVRKRSSVVFITIFNEEANFLGKCLKKIRHAMEMTGGSFTIIAVVDGYTRFRHAEVLLPIAKQHCDVVLTSDAQNKNENLLAMYREAKRRGLLATGEEVIHFVDSDTLPVNDQVAIEIMRSFFDPEVGGVTTAQYIYKPKGFWQTISNIFEIARTYGSQAMLSLFGVVGCLPGRWYGVLAKYLSEEKMLAVANDSFSYFGFVRRRCVAGDDRRITMRVMQGGGRTIMNPFAQVYTLAPSDFSLIHKMWVRWGRSSQGHTIRSPWLFKPRFWPTAFVYWGDIILTISTIFIVFIHWPYMVWVGESTVPIIESLIMAFISMAMVMTLRQAPGLVAYPKHLPYMLIIGFIAIFAHICRLEALLTQHRIGRWDTRAGADENKVTEPTFTVYYDRREY